MVKLGVSLSTKEFVSGRASRNRSSNSFWFSGNLVFELALNFPAGKGVKSDLLVCKRAIGLRFSKEAWAELLPRCPLELVG